LSIGTKAEHTSHFHISLSVELGNGPVNALILGDGEILLSTGKNGFGFGELEDSDLLPLLLDVDDSLPKVALLALLLVSEVVVVALVLAEKPNLKDVDTAGAAVTELLLSVCLAAPNVNVLPVELVVAGTGAPKVKELVLLDEVEGPFAAGLVVAAPTSNPNLNGATPPTLLKVDPEEDDFVSLDFLLGFGSEQHTHAQTSASFDTIHVGHSHFELLQK